MHAQTIQIRDVIYDASEKQFQATVRISDAAGSRSYACVHNAPADLSFQRASKALADQARRSDAARAGVYTRLTRHLPGTCLTRRGFDPKRWLDTVLNQPLHLTA